MMERIVRVPDATEIRITPAMVRLYENQLPNLKNVSYSVTAEFEVEGDEADGVLIAQGGRYNGWALYLKEGRPVYVYNVGNRDRTYIRGEEKVSPGKHELEYRFDYDGGGIGKGGDGTLLLDGVEIGRARLEQTLPFIYEPLESTNLGIDRGSPVTYDYSRGEGNPFVGGRVIAAVIRTKDDAVSPTFDQKVQVALAAE
jgi:hypothetical protein